MSGQVKGTVFVDYVRMLRGHKGTDWSKHLPPEDLSFLVQRIEADTWYPMESFERLGLAILAEIAHGSLETVRAFGRFSIDRFCHDEPRLLAPGDPLDTLMRFRVLRQGFFDYPALEISSASDGEASIRIGYQMGALAEEAASWQTLGFFERLLEVAGAQHVQAWFSTRVWVGDPSTMMELRWEP